MQAVAAELDMIIRLMEGLAVEQLEELAKEQEILPHVLEELNLKEVLEIMQLEHN